MLWSVWLIISSIVSRIVVFVSVDAQHREVTCVTRPHPVVSVTTKFTNAFRRVTYETNISVCAVNEKIKLITVEETFHFSFVLSTFCSLASHLTDLALNCSGAICFAHVCSNAIKNCFSNILDTHQE